MSLIKWSVVNLPERDGRCVGLEVDESLAPLRALFFEIDESYYPRVIEAALTGTGSGFNSAGVIFPNDLEEDDEQLDPNLVEIYDALDSILIPRDVFLQVLLDVSESALKERVKRGTASTEWKLKMEKEIKALRSSLMS